MKSLAATVTLSVLLASSAVFAADRPRLNADGTMLVDSSGMTLYTFGLDSPGKSKCYGKCEANWPPLEASRGARASGQYSIVKRSDGTRQWALRGWPLYTFVNDKAPGQTTGEGVAGAWHVTAP